MLVEGIVECIKTSSLNASCISGCIEYDTLSTVFITRGVLASMRFVDGHCECTC